MEIAKQINNYKAKKHESWLEGVEKTLSLLMKEPLLIIEKNKEMVIFSEICYNYCLTKYTLTVDSIRYSFSNYLLTQTANPPLWQRLDVLKAW